MPASSLTFMETPIFKAGNWLTEASEALGAEEGGAAAVKPTPTALMKGMDGKISNGGEWTCFKNEKWEKHITEIITAFKHVTDLTREARQKADENNTELDTLEARAIAAETLLKRATPAATGQVDAEEVQDAVEGRLEAERASEQLRNELHRQQREQAAIHQRLLDAKMNLEREVDFLWTRIKSMLERQAQEVKEQEQQQRQAGIEQQQQQQQQAREQFTQDKQAWEQSRSAARDSRFIRDDLRGLQFHTAPGGGGGNGGKYKRKTKRKKGKGKGTRRKGTRRKGTRRKGKGKHKRTRK